MTPNQDKLILCPYCGHPQHGGTRCVECGGLFDALSLKATQVAMGPWFIRDKANPFRPGCAYDVVVRHARAGKIKPTTVMRGPTTRQFWAVARNVPGVAHLLGYCHNCNHHVQPGERRCPSCGAHFAAVQHRNELGLMFPTEAAVKTASQVLEKELAAAGGAAGGTGGGGPRSSVTGSTPKPSSGSALGKTAASAGGSLGANLLRDVLGDDAMFNVGAADATGGGGDQGNTPQSPAPVKTGFMDMGDSTSRTGGPRSPQRLATTSVTSSHALDFVPSDNAEATEEEAQAGGTGAQLSNLQQQNRKLSLMTWLLVAFNVLVLLGVVLLFVYYFKAPPGNPLPGSPTPGNPPAVSPAPGTSSTQINPNIQRPTQMQNDAILSPDGTSQTTTQNELASSQASPTPGSSISPGTPGTPGSPRTPSIFDNGLRATGQHETDLKVVAGLELAQELENKKSYKDALGVLTTLQGMTANAQLNDQIAKATRRVKAQITPAEFYGLKVN